MPDIQRPRDALREFVAEPEGRAAAHLRQPCSAAACQPRIARVPTFVFGNVFLHLHSVRTHRWTPALDDHDGAGHHAATSAFLITLITGVLLMFYYKPYPGRGLRLDQGHPLRRSRPAASSATSTAGRRT